MDTVSVPVAGCPDSMPRTFRYVGHGVVTFRYWVRTVYPCGNVKAGTQRRRGAI